MNKLKITATDSGNTKLVLNDIELKDVKSYCLEESENDIYAQVTITLEVKLEK